MISSVSSSSVPVPTSFKELGQRFAVYKKTKDPLVLGVPGFTRESDPQNMAKFIIPILEEFTDLEDMDARKDFLNKFKTILPNVSKNPDIVRKIVAAFSTAISETIKLTKTNDVIRELTESESFFKNHVNDWHSLIDASAKRLESYEANFAGFTKSVNARAAKGDLDLLDVSLFMSSIRFLAKLRDTMKCPDLTDRLNLLYEIEAELKSIRGSDKLKAGFLSTIFIERMLLCVAKSKLDIFTRECLSKQTFIPDFCRQHKIFETWPHLKGKELLPKVMDVFFKRHVKPLPKKKPKPIEISIPVLDLVKAPDLIAPRPKCDDSKTPDDSDGYEVQENLKDSFVFVEVESRPEEAVLDKFAYRVQRWMRQSPAEPLDETVFPEYAGHLNPKRMIDFHGFSHRVDEFYDRGIKTVWENETTKMDDTLYLIPAQMDDGSGPIQGAIAYCISSQDGMCYHRYFQPMTMLSIIDRFGTNVFYPVDFPELSAANEKDEKPLAPIQEDAEDTVVEDPLLRTIEIEDKRLGIRIQLFPSI